MWVAGADACKAGWVCAAQETVSGTLRFAVVMEVRDLIELLPQPVILCIDIPIGLPDRGARECDRLARSVLGWPRRNSVFPAPVRPALIAAGREEASRITQLVDGRRVSAQGWALYEKIREVDALLGSIPEAQQRIREVHPEVSFWAWNHEQAIQEGKKTRAGREIRLRLVEGWLGNGVLTRARAGRAKHDVGDDDILDAIAALWTAARLAMGAARTLPESPVTDATGLRMEIVY